MKKIITIILCLLIAEWSNAQLSDSWTEKNAMGLNTPASAFMTPRMSAVGFSIGTKGYIGTGNDGTSGYRNDFWEFDPSSNTWTQKANCGTIGRAFAVGFSIGSKGYIGTGLAPSSSADFWEYDPAVNTWVQKANFPGGNRSIAVGFSISGKGYLGTGTGNSTTHKDIWEYDPATNGWTQKSDFGGVARYQAIGFSIGTKGYIGTGSDGTNLKNDFWQFDPIANTWTQKANFGGTARSQATGFGIGSKGYIGTGTDNTITFNDFWEYDPSINLWMQKQNFGGTARFYATGFSIGTKGYLATGATANFACNDLWEFSQSGNSWTLKTDANNTSRISAVGFSIGTKGYIGTGYDGSYKNDFWEYDLAAGTWTQKANFGGTARKGAVGFSINSKGYIGTGYDGSYKNDFWEYDPALNSWTQKANFTGTARSLAIGFNIGSKGYIGTGTLANNNFYEYNPTTNSWIQKASFGGAARVAAAGFSIGNKGYIGTGQLSGGILANDFWEYDPALNSWSQKAAFAGPARYNATGFNIGIKGYIGTGNIGLSNYTNDFWEYDPSANQWIQRAAFGGIIRSGAVAFSSATKGYLGAGSYGVYKRNDLWEYTSPCSSITATITPGGPLTICPGGSVILTANSGIGYSYQWKLNGNNISGATAQNYTAAQAGGYSVQVCSVVSAVTIVSSISSPVASISANGSTTFCSGSVVLSAFTNSLYTYQWQKNSSNISGATNSNYTASQAGSYRCIVTNPCGTSTSNTITVTISSLTVTISPSGTAVFCTGSSVLLTASAGTGYTWQWRKNGIDIAGATLQTYSASQAGNFTVAVTQGTCSATSAAVVVSASQPLTPAITNYGYGGFCSSTTVNLRTSSIPGVIYQWFEDTHAIPNSNSTDLYAGHNGNYIVTASNGCGTYSSPVYTVTDFDMGSWPYLTHYNVITYTGSLTICATGGSVELANDNYTPYFSPLFQWYKDGVAIPGANNSNYTATTAGAYVCSVSDYQWWCGYGPVVFSNWLTVNTVAGTNPAVSITAAGPTVWCGTGSVLLNSSATNAILYQWKKNSSNISGATLSSYTATSSGSYSCYVANSCGNATSNTISVTSQTSPVPVIHASGSTTVCQPTYVYLYVTVGSGSFTYQWKKNGTDISFATNYYYYATVSGTYTVVTTNTCGSATSGSIVVTVNTTPTVSVSAAGSTTFCSGGTVTLNAASTGTTYQWKKDGTNISGATLSSYTASTAGSYTCYVTNNCGNATSNSIAVTVNGLPLATITPSGPTTFCSGGSVVLNAPVSANRSYQWKKGANLISGATLSSYTATTGGNYRVIVTNTVTGCSKTTNSATVVTVNGLPTATATPQGPTTFCAGGSVVLVANTGTGLTYKWKKNNIYIPGATLVNYTATTAGIYKVQVTNSNTCSKTSAVVTVTVPCKEGEIISSVPETVGIDFAVYPNPNSGVFTIGFSSKINFPVEIKMTDALGKIVLKFETNDEIVVINELNLRKGIYSLIVRDKNGIAVKKISIMK